MELSTRRRHRRGELAWHQAGRSDVVTCFPTEMGWVAAAASSRGLRRLSLPAPTADQALEALEIGVSPPEQESGTLVDLVSQVQAFLRGAPVVFTVPLDLAGAPPFFRAVWRACLRIPRGELRTYAWLAAEASNPKAVRAAGQAMARNPIPLIIPCHRVVGKDASLTGYGGGLEMKRRLLALESI